MICEAIKLPDGETAIVCTGKRRRRRCSVKDCIAPATKECDYPAPHRKSRTCDKPLCDAHAVNVGENRDHCPDHPKHVQTEMVL